MQQREIDNIVKQTADKLDVDVCSLYLADNDRKTLRLASSVGLDKSVVGDRLPLTGFGPTENTTYGSLKPFKSTEGILPAIYIYIYLYIFNNNIKTILYIYI